MESEKRLYSVLTRAEILDKMMKEIVQISEVFSISQSDATLTLIRLGWDSFRASDLLGDNKEKFLSKLGLVQVSDPNHTNGEGETLVSTPLCSHKFCSDCWKDHLEKVDKKEMISCLNQHCVAASVGLDTIEKLSKPVKEMYERYVVGSFMESKKIKWCPASRCEYAIQRHDDQDGGAEDDDDENAEEEEEEEECGDDLGVVCLCGHTFCWKCKLESHRPVTCNNASLWLNQLLEEARTLSQNPRTTKPCPSCNANVQKRSNVDWQIVTCHCSHAFCWKCLVSKEDHREASQCREVHVPPPNNEVALLHHLTLWEESHNAMIASKRDLEAIELHSIPLLTSRRGLGELDMRALREAYVLIIQCRLVLKWSCMYGYFLTDYYHSEKKKYLDHLRGVATANLVKHGEIVNELVKEAISGGDIRGFRHKVETLTTATGNYFHYFVKTVEDGLSDVKDGVFEDVPTDYWFCDRCTFQNDSFEQKCRVCVFPFEGPSPLVANSNNSIAVAQQQEVPNVSSNLSEPALPEAAFGNSDESVDHQPIANVSNNPFAREVLANRFNMGLGNNRIHQQQVPNLANNPFAASPGGTFSGPVSSHQQLVPNMGNNGFASSREGPIFFQSPPPPVAAYQQELVPNMANLNPFARPGGGTTYPSQSAPFVAFGNNNNNNNGAHAPDMMMVNNPFARPGGGTTYPSQSAPFVAFGNNNNGAQAPDMMMVNNPFVRQGGAHPRVGFGNNNVSSSGGHQQQEASNVPNNPAAALVKEEAKPWKFD